MVSLRTNPANTFGNPGHLLSRATDAELFEAAKLRNDKIGVGHIPRIVQKDFDFTVTFQARNWVNLNRFNLASPFPLPPAVSFTLDRRSSE